MEKSREKTVLVTSSGDEVSRNIVLNLARRGFRVVVMGNEKCLNIEKIRSERVAVMGLDMEEESEGPFQLAVEKAFTAFPNSYVVAFLHSYFYQGKSTEHLELSEDEFRKIVKVNLMAPWYLLNAVARRMRSNQRGGSMVLLTSIVGAERGLHQGAAAYASCAAALQQLARVSALEIGKYDIRVNAIARGLHVGDEYIESVGKDKAEELVKEVVPLQRWLDPQNDIISTVLYLISDASRYITGTTIFVDGAQSLTRPRMRSYM